LGLLLFVSLFGTLRLFFRLLLGLRRAVLWSRLLPGLLGMRRLLFRLRFPLRRFGLLPGSLLRSCGRLGVLLWFLLLLSARLRLWSLCLRALLLGGVRRRRLRLDLLFCRRLSLLFLGLFLLRVPKRSKS
jgi:hypothetical protein